MAVDADLDHLAHTVFFHCKVTLFKINFCHDSFEHPGAIPFKNNHTPNYTLGACRRDEGVMLLFD